MSLLKIREERKKLGSGLRRGPRTVTLVLLLALVLLLIYYLSRIS
jgi:flagellar biogenesis protein FliO